jgi:hypothetical protein
MAPYVMNFTGSAEEISAANIVAQLECDVLDAQDNLLATKISQAEQSNKDCGPDPDYEIGQNVKLNTKNRRRQYLHAGEGHCAKFMPRFDGPYVIIGVHKECSTVTLSMVLQPGIFPVFHMSEIKLYIENDPTLFPNRQLPRPSPITTDNGEEEWEIDKIIDERCCGCGVQYLVCWTGHGSEDEQWLPGCELAECEALDQWLAGKEDGTEIFISQAHGHW